MSSEKFPKMQFLKIKHPNSTKALKNKEKQQVFIPSVCMGEQDEPDVKPKSHLNYDLFLVHREEILACKDLTHQLWLMMREN